MCNSSKDWFVDSTLLEQYRHCAEDWRHFDRLLWQIPFSTATVVSAVIAIAYGYFQEQLVSIPMMVKVFLFSSLIVLVVAMALLSRKIRYFQEGRTRFLNNLIEKIEENVKEEDKRIKKFPFETKEIYETLEKKSLVGYRTIHFQNFLYLSFLITLGYLLWREAQIIGLIAIFLVTLVIVFFWFYNGIMAKLKEYYLSKI